MHARHGSAAVIALLLAGCGGGGGSDDTQVSANPPASPAPATPQPAPVSPPRVDMPSPIQTPAPKPGVPAPAPEPSPQPSPNPPPPASTPAPQPAPPAPQPSPVVPPAPVAPPAVMISGEVLVRAMSTWVDPSSDGLAWGIAPDGSRAWWGQRSGVSPIYPGSYSHSSGAEGLVPLGIPTTYFENGQYQLGTYLEANQVRLYRSSTVPIGPGTSHPLDRTIAEWRPQAAQDPWFVQFMLQTEARSNTVFRMCWHVRVPSIIRLSCGLFDRLTGDYRGMVLVDDSNGLGAKTWETR